MLKCSLEDFSLLETYTYKTHTGEGWGITSLGKDLAVTDGSEYLYIWDGETFAEKRRFRVRV